jgi:beta-galactosidase
MTQNGKFNRLFLLAMFLSFVLCGWARDVQRLDKGWRFIKAETPGASQPEFDDSVWTQVSVPHTWNAEDGQTGKGYYRGPGWYRLHIAVPERTTGQRLFVHFGAASLVSDVYCNGRHVGHHRGGFAAFSYELTRFVNWGKDNVLAVRVSNEWAADVAPLEGDFNMFGGLYRPVQLILTDSVCISPLDYGGPGVYLKQAKVKPNAATIEATVKVSNVYLADKEANVKITVLDADNKIIASSEKTSAINSPTTPIVQTLTIQKPHLWNGRKDPYLYTVRANLFIGEKNVDSLEQPLGLRYFRVDPKEGFFLNGQPYPLHGVCKHQDIQGRGWAMTRQDMEGDMAIMSELGVTCVRLAHYQHGDYMYELCDKAGMVVWTEIPLVNYILNSEGFRNNARQQLIELIRQNYNHSSVICWGLYNELVQGGGDRNQEYPRALIKELNALAHQEDTARPTTAASNDPALRYPGLRDIADLEAWNVYPGWYWGRPEDISSKLDEYNEQVKYKGLGVSEYGAGASIQQHEQGMIQRPKTDGKWHPEEWQAFVHEKTYAEIEKRPFVWGSFVWCMFDFASDWRNEGDRRGINDKGLVTYDRRVKKDAFYFYKAAWSGEPVVYITSRRHTPRNSQTTPVKIYTNCQEVELKVNGVSLGSHESENHTCLWSDVNLQKGSNQIEVFGKQDQKVYRDSCTWDYQPPKETDTETVKKN